MLAGLMWHPPSEVMARASQPGAAGPQGRNTRR